jgi:hypothetical protein
MKIKQHKVLPSGVHSVIDQDNVVHIFTEEEFRQIHWWTRAKMFLEL